MKSKISLALLALALPAAAFATEYQTIERPRQECWNEQVQVQQRGYDAGGTIIGGIAGGLLGNQVGHGNGRTAATAVGAITGAMVGERMSSQPSYSTQSVQRCRTVIERVQVPVYREPAQVWVEQQPVYIPRAEYYYVRPGERERREHWEHDGWHERRHDRDEHRHHHHEDDD
ncbi:glycine zipper 2TM domain-containing protein [Janthinobacterium sp. PAMC25594]|uniref:glycine zipper 2TM domain-containing protein n=1 Tax=Janthinobacterium sp. PAMC25594 TaxID=2861284 RepID=UPI001C637310|nr:glycine zipper 2TM domain-containing protein [Janthinobacterium sp. PAMC25594]QYG08902.1 glycine zipper 2TM domain-containing protein [Janthinobacterium sp. PAMC25594]